MAIVSFGLEVFLQCWVFWGLGGDNQGSLFTRTRPSCLWFPNLAGLSLRERSSS